MKSRARGSKSSCEGATGAGFIDRGPAAKLQKVIAPRLLGVALELLRVHGLSDVNLLHSCVLEREPRVGTSRKKNTPNFNATIYKVPLREVPRGVAQERNPSIQHVSDCLWAIKMCLVVVKTMFSSAAREAKCGEASSRGRFFLSESW